jgi:hypothetical protein
MKDPTAIFHTIPNDTLKGIITRLYSAGERDLAAKAEKILKARPKRKERVYKTPPEGAENRGDYWSQTAQQPHWVDGKDAWANGNDPRCKGRSR